MDGLSGPTLSCHSQIRPGGVHVAASVSREESDDGEFQAKAALFQRAKALVFMMTDNAGPTREADGALFWVDPFKLTTDPGKEVKNFAAEVDTVVVLFGKLKGTLNHPCANKGHEFGATSVNLPYADINKLAAYAILSEDNFPTEALARAEVLLDEKAAHEGKRAAPISVVSSEEEGDSEGGGAPPKKITKVAKPGEGDGDPPPPKKIIKVTNPGEGKAKTEKGKAQSTNTKEPKEQWSSNASGLAVKAISELETAIGDGAVDSQALLKFTTKMNEAEGWWAKIRTVNEKSTAGAAAKKRAGVLLGAWNPSPRPQPCPLLHSCLLPYPSSSGNTGAGEEALALGHVKLFGRQALDGHAGGKHRSHSPRPTRPTHPRRPHYPRHPGGQGSRGC